MDPAGSEKVTRILYQCFLTMELYGKEPGQFTAIDQMFQNFLKDWPADKIVAAFERYVRQRTEFPKVADILGILEERIKPDKPMYLAIKKRQQRGETLSWSDESYIKKYEKQVKEDWE